MKTLINVLYVLRNFVCFAAMAIVAATVVLGVLLTNSEIKFFGMLAIKVFMTSVVIGFIHHFLSKKFLSNP